MAEKYLKVLSHNQTNNSDYIYRIDEINEASMWNPHETEPSKIGGFNFSIESKILMFLYQGDILYDVKIPLGTEMKECSSNSSHGVFRSNKIILTNPRPITDEIAMKLYKKSKLPEKSYFKALAGCAKRGYLKTAEKILKDKINEENIAIAISEFEDFFTTSSEEFNFQKNLTQPAQMIYKELQEKIMNIK